MSTDAPNIIKDKKKAQKERLDEVMREDMQIVKGRFRNLETPGMALKFVFRKYPSQPLKKYTLEDGHDYELPRCVVKHLNGGCSYVVNKFAQDNSGHVHPTVGRRIHRYQFQPLEFAGLE